MATGNIGDPPNPPALSGASRIPLRRLRALRTEGLGGNLTELRRLLTGIADPHDLETAGRLLAGPQQLAELRRTDAFPQTSLIVYGNSTLDALPATLIANGVRDGVLVTAHLADFNTWRTDLLTGSPRFADLAPTPVALVLDDTAVFDVVRDAVDVDEIEQRCAELPAELSSWITRAKKLFGSVVIITTIPLSPLRRDSVIDYQTRARLDAAWTRLNARLLELAGPGVVVLAHEGIAAHAHRIFGPDRMRHIAGVTFAAGYLSRLAAELSTVLLAQLGRAKKCLVLDLDGTLWDGVVGDDGLAGLRIGGAYPGSAHLELQRLALALGAQGVILAVVSKNHEEVALAAMAEHPEMVLRPGSILVHRIDFEPKPRHARDIAEELNIDVGALVFVDDSEVERGLMRAMQPGVTVVDLAGDPAEFASRLAGLGAFNLLSRTAEDGNRAQMYLAEDGRSRRRESAESMESYLTGLGMTLHLLPGPPLNATRTAQLFGKTNQFNLTGRRYTVDDVTAPREGGRPRFVVGRLSDTFGDSGIVVAAAIAEPDEQTWSIENMVLSCRAFSRGIEDGMLASILAAAAAGGRTRVRGRFVPSAKNRAFAEFFRRNGFDELPGELPGEDEFGATHWQRSTQPLALPGWLTVSLTAEVFDVPA